MTRGIPRGGLEPLCRRGRMSRLEKGRLDKCVGWIASRIDGLPRQPESLGEAPDSRVQVLLRRAGFLRRTDRALGAMRDALAKEGIHSYPELDDPTLGRNDRVYFFRTPIPGLSRPGALFNDEHTLEDFIVSNFDRLPSLRGLRLRSRQYRFPGSQRTIDLLCEDRPGRHLVGIELKHGPADRGLPAQMIEYMVELERLAKRERRGGFRGIVITGQPDPKLRDVLASASAAHGYRVDWLVYEASISLRSSSGAN